MVGNDFNVLSNLSQGRWRGIYTPPRNIWPLEHLMTGSTGTQAVVPLASGTTGQVPDQVPKVLQIFSILQFWAVSPLRYYPQAVVPVVGSGTTGLGGSTGPKYRLVLTKTERGGC